MKIISKYKDYYDSVQGVMYDSEIKYIRKSECHTLEDIRLPGMNHRTFSELEFIGFCGKIYPLIKFTNLSYESNDIIISKHKWFKRTIDAIADTYIDYDIVENLHACTDKRQYENTQRYKRRLNRYNLSIENFYKNLERLNLFEKYQTPIFLINSQSNETILDTGPLLKDYNFQSIMDPYTAYQELVMWIGNLAVNEYPPQITDNIVMRDKKGFNKWSFKTRPTKKRK